MRQLHKNELNRTTGGFDDNTLAAAALAGCFAGGVIAGCAGLAVSLFGVLFSGGAGCAMGASVGLGQYAYGVLTRMEAG